MPAQQDLITDSSGVTRCRWCGDDPLYIDYHDNEWGVDVRDDRALFERICLEGFQAGLSWITILKKRDAFREAFIGFDFEVVSTFGKRDVSRLLKNTGIVRHRGKIEATINNAQRAIELIEQEGSLSDYLWSRAPDTSRRRAPRAMVDVPSTTAESTALSKDLRKRGWRFVGPTTIYAMMQATGMVNDHIEGCHTRDRTWPADKVR